MHHFVSENQIYTGTVICGAESFKSLKGQENLCAEKSTTENLRINVRKVRYSKNCNLTRVFDFPPSDLMCTRYCRSADARILM